jgi:membrane protein DedA with SNARE-associated domain
LPACWWVPPPKAAFRCTPGAWARTIGVDFSQSGVRRLAIGGAAGDRRYYNSKASLRADFIYLTGGIQPRETFVSEFLLENGGYLGIIFFLVLTGCGLPIPEEVPIVLAGIFSSQGKLVPEWAFASCLIGALLGDSVMYAIGYHFGHGLVARHPKYGKFVGAQREEYFEQAIQRHSFKVMLLARFMVGVRGPVYLAAGVVRMPFRRFILCDLICATLVVGTFFALSYAYGEEIYRMVRRLEWSLTLIVLLVAGVVFLWWMRRRRQKHLDALLLARALEEEAKQTPAEVEEPRSKRA